MIEYNDKTKKFELSASPSELRDLETYSPLYRISGLDDHRATTQLKVTYVDNTKFIDQIQITTKDNLADTINKIGEVAKAGIPFLAALVEGSAAPAGFKFEKTMLDPALVTLDQWHRDEVNQGYCLRLRSVAVESSLTIEDFLSKAAGKSSNTFPVPACSRGTVDIAPCTDPRSVRTETLFSGAVTFAHHRNVLPVPLPSTGSMKMHPVCGASVTEADKQDRTDILDTLKNLMNKAEEVRSAWKKERDKSAKK